MINVSSYIKFFIAALLGCFFICACENKMEEIDKRSKKQASVEEGKDIESYLSNGGVLKAKLTAPVFLRHQTQVPKVEFPKTLHVDFYDSLKRIESRLSAKYGEYKENENKVFLRDSIVVFNVKGDTLWTDELYWDQNQQVFYTEKPVVISQTAPQRQKIYGIGLTASQDLSRLSIRNIQPPSFTNVPDSTYR
jgi:LPS export ABC transporter protein LptC